MDRETMVTVEGRDVLVQAALSDGVWWVDFVLADSLRVFLDSDRAGPSPWFEMVRWRSPRAALLAVWSAVQTILPDGAHCAFEASDDRRASVYSRLLSGAGIPHEVVVRDIDDTVIFV